MQRPPHAPSPRRIPLVVWLGLMFLVLSLGFVGLALRSHADDGSTNGPSRGERRSVAIAYVDVEGGVASLYPLKPGRVVEVWAQEGKEVPAGTKLFRMEDTIEKIQVEQAQIDLEAAQEKLAHARQFVEQHEKNVAAHKQAVEVFKKKVEAARALNAKAKRFFESKYLGGSKEDVQASAAAVGEAEAAVKVAEAKLAVVEATDPGAGVRLAEFDVRNKQKVKDKADFGLSQCVIVAPVKGTVLRSHVQVGEVLGPSPRQPAMQFCPSGPRIVRAEVEQEFAGRVALGQTARIQDDSSGGGDWRGKVVHVSDWYSQRRSVVLEPLQFNDVRTLEVIIRLTPADQKPHLRIGQRVRVTLESKD